MRLLYKNDYDISPWKSAFWVVAFFASFFIINGVGNVLYAEGFELTVSGTVQTHELKYDKMFNYDYTKVGLRTYAESYSKFYLLGHHELEVGKTYRITYVRTTPLGHHQFLIREVVEIEELS